MMKKMIKITKKEMFAAMKAMLSGEVVENVSVEEAMAFCDKEIENLEKKAEKAKEKATEKKEKVDELAEAILNVLGEDLMTISDITAALPEELQATVAKVTYRVARTLKDKVEKGEVEIPATEHSKKRVVVAYRALSDK